ncbi:hypothetical protein [Salegentibacter sp. Hel_I_6]|uniref:hypothetical protein n=1 Tax=Salegentibacter sp. Hel_I_6 TaxID=1250278 RepID=UPI00055C9BCF|nr:hypothetical protein [Salegentibacter sp. Hel_I_6]
MNFNNLTTTERSILNSINDALILERLQNDNSDHSISIKENCQGIEIAFKILGITSEPLKEDLTEIFTAVSDLNLELLKATKLIYSEWTCEIINQTKINSIIKSLEK